MKFIGITGSYATGKSHILNHLRKLNYQAFSADEFISDLYKKDEIKANILEILPEIKTFDKVAIALLIYRNAFARQKIQNYIHPKVTEALKKFKLDNLAEEMIFAEIPLLFESGHERHFDYIVTTFCSEKSRLKRAKLKANFNEEYYNKIAQIQFSQSVKISKAHFKVDTDQNEEDLINQLINIIKIVEIESL